METTPSEPTNPAQLQTISIASIWPFGVFIVAMACINLVVGFVQAWGIGLSSVEWGAEFVASAIGAAEYAIAIVLGGLVFRHWIVGVTVSVFVAGFWFCSYPCWQFVFYHPSLDRAQHIYSTACLAPVTVLAGCFPLLLTRIAMCQACPKGNSIVELFAITSFLASFVSVTRLGVVNAVVGEIIFFLVATTLVSALSITPASLLYFTARDSRQSTQRFIYFTSSLAALLCSLPIIAGFISILPLVWLLLLFATVLLGLHCMRLSGFRIPYEINSPEERTMPRMRSAQAQFVWVIVSTIACAFSINLVAAIINMK